MNQSVRHCGRRVAASILIAAAMLYPAGGPLFAQEDGSESQASGSDRLNEALRKDWGAYRMQWGDKQYRAGGQEEEEEEAEESQEATSEESDAAALTRETPKTLRSGIDEEPDASRGSSLRSLEGTRTSSSQAGSSEAAGNPSP